MRNSTSVFRHLASCGPALSDSAHDESNPTRHRMHSFYAMWRTVPCWPPGRNVENVPVRARELVDMVPILRREVPGDRGSTVVVERCLVFNRS